MVNALEERLQFFVEIGAALLNTGWIMFLTWRPTPKRQPQLSKRLWPVEPLTQKGSACTTYLLISLGRLYKKYNVAMQIHYSCLRNVNQKILSKKAGPRYWL